MPRTIVTEIILDNGDMKINTEGATGPECQLEHAGLFAALGFKPEELEETLLPEYYEQIQEPDARVSE